MVVTKKDDLLSWNDDDDLLGKDEWASGLGWSSSTFDTELLGSGACGGRRVNDPVLG